MDEHEAYKIYSEKHNFIRSAPHTDDEWARFYSDIIRLMLDHADVFGRHAVQLLSHAYSAQHLSKRYQKHTIEKTFIPDAVDAILQTEKVEELLMEFSHFVDTEDILDYQNWWHERLSKEPHSDLIDNVCALGDLEWSLFDRSNWNLAWKYIEPYLDHSNDLVRASAAGALARLYVEKVPGFPPIQNTMSEIQQRDIKRPGVAGPFWFTLKSDYSIMRVIGELEFDELEWLLEIIEKRDGEDLYYPCYNWVDFLAYDVAKNNVDALRRLFKANSQEMAISLASEFDEYTDEFRDVLIEMGNSEEYNYCSTGSCLLAYNYGILHPEGARKGIVEEHIMEDARIFWIKDEDSIGLAAVIYPIEGQLHDLLAWKWIDRVLPPDDRNSLWDPTWSDDAVDFGATNQGVTLYGNVRDKVWDNVTVREPTRKDWANKP